MRARRLSDDREVAVAFLDPTGEPIVPRRFDRLRRNLQRLSQDDVGIVPVLDHGTGPDGRPYLVMPFHPTGSLQDQLERGPTPWYPASSLIAEAADIAGRVHDEGIVLGDLRPSKILLAAVDKPVIAAFGMATRRFDDGLPTYRAPETTNDDPGSPAADVYALCLILGALITGSPMEPDEEIATFLARAAEQAPDRILEVLEHGLSLSPTNRPGSGATLGGALRQALAAGPDADVVAGTQTAVDLDHLLASEPDEEVLSFEPSPDDLQADNELGPEALPPDLGDIVFVDRRPCTTDDDDPTASLPAAEADDAEDEPAEVETDPVWDSIAATITVNDLRLDLIDHDQPGAEDRVDADPDIDIDTDIFPPTASQAIEAERNGSSQHDLQIEPDTELEVEASAATETDPDEPTTGDAVAGDDETGELATEPGDLAVDDLDHDTDATGPDEALAETELADALAETDESSVMDEAAEATEPGEHDDGAGLADDADDAGADDEPGEPSDADHLNGENSNGDDGNGGLDREVIDLSELFSRTIEFVPPTATVDLALDATPAFRPTEPVANGDSTNLASRTVEPPGQMEPELGQADQADQTEWPQPPRLPMRTQGWVDEDQTEIFPDETVTNGNGNGLVHDNGHEPEVFGHRPGTEWSAQSRNRHMQSELDWLTGVKVRLELMWFRSRRTAATLGAVLGLLLIAAIVIFFAAQELRSGGGTIQTEGLPGPTPQPPAAPASSLTVPSTFVGADAPFITEVAPPVSSSTTTTLVVRRPVTAPEPPAPTTTAEPATTETTVAPTSETTIEVLPTTTPDGSTTEPDDTSQPPTSPSTAPSTTERVTTTRPGRPTITIPTSWPPGNGGDAAVATAPALVGPQATSVGRRRASLSYSSPSCVATRFLLSGDDGSTQSGSSTGYDAAIACSTSWQLDFGGTSALRPDTGYTLTVWIKDAGGRTSTGKVDFTTRR